MKTILSSIAALVLAALAASVDAALAETQAVCAGSVPSGWIKIDDHWDPTKCGNPATIASNVWTIERYAGKPKGAVMSACSDSPPRGWSIVSQRWEPTKCGRPGSATNNVMTIKRLNDDPDRDRRPAPAAMMPAPPPPPVQTAATATFADPVAAYVKERAIIAYEEKGFSTHLVRFVADFNNDGLMDTAVTVWPFTTASPEWYLYLQDKQGRYARAENINFHPLYISIQPLDNGAKIITARSSSAPGDGNIVERTMVGREMLPSSRDHDKSEADELFGGLRDNPVSEYCPTPDYFKNACKWDKGY